MLWYIDRQPDPTPEQKCEEYSGNSLKCLMAGNKEGEKLYLHYTKLSERSQFETILDEMMGPVEVTVDDMRGMFYQSKTPTHFNDGVNARASTALAEIGIATVRSRPAISPSIHFFKLKHLLSLCVS